MSSRSAVGLVGDDGEGGGLVVSLTGSETLVEAEGESAGHVHDDRPGGSRTGRSPAARREPHACGVEVLITERSRPADGRSRAHPPDEAIW
jgi:hypothetical protein